MSLTTQFFVFDTENTVPKSTLYKDNETNFFPVDLIDYDIALLPSQLRDTQNETRVWLTSLVAVSAKPREEEVIFNYDIESAIDTISTIKSGVRSRASVGFCHNLSYDGPMIMDRLLKTGYSYQTGKELTEAKKRAPERGCFTANMTEKGRIYAIKIRFKNNNTVEFRDSANIMPGTVDSIAKNTDFDKMTGTVDYSKPRPVGYIPDEVELKYAANDVLIIAQALHGLFAVAPLLMRKQTIGGAALEYMKRSLVSEELGLDIINEDHWNPTVNKYRDRKYDQLMGGELVRDTDEFFRSAYFGGISICNRKNSLIDKNQIVDMRNQPFEKMGTTFDVNSLYPSVMFNHEYPIGMPIWNDNKHFVPNYPKPYFVRFKASFKTKEDHLPFIQLKGNQLFGESEYVYDSLGVVERTMAKPDFELFLEQYDVFDFEVIKWCEFNSRKNLFDHFVNYFYHMKETSVGSMYLFAKLMLNNCYGKLAQAPNRSSGIPYLDEDGVLKVEELKAESEGAYVPIGAYITAYARCVTMRAAQKNYDILLYIDTDSMHLAGFPVDIDIHPTNLGQWDHESTWDLARFTRQKGYIERTVDPKTKKPIPINVGMIKAAGATMATKERIIHDLSTYENGEWTFVKYDGTQRKLSDMEILTKFTYGLKEAGKLMRRRVSGGVILKETTFTISPPKDTEVNPVTGLADTLISVV